MAFELTDADLTRIKYINPTGLPVHGYFELDGVELTYAKTKPLSFTLGQEIGIEASSFHPVHNPNITPIVACHCKLSDGREFVIEPHNYHTHKNDAYHAMIGLASPYKAAAA